MPDLRRATEKERELARRLLAAEDGENASPEGLADALVLALDRLGEGLGGLIGPAGFEALLRRALHLARGEWPFLQDVQVQLAAEGVHLTGLAESVRGQDPTAVRQGLVAILANLIWLLVTFVGAAIGFRLIHRVFPETPPVPGGSGSEGKT